MPSRVLETVLTGRNLLSPVLASAGKDVEALNAAVAEANTEAAATAADAAVAQETAAAKVVEANARSAESAKVAGAEAASAQRTAAEGAAASADTQVAASTKVVESNARVRESSLALADTTESTALRSAASWQKLATVGLPLVAVAAAAITGKMAGDYQQLVTKLETTAGESQQNLKLVSDGMLDMAGKVGISADELARGMYTVESSGIHGADGLTVLKAAAQGARQENADLAKVTDAVTTALHDYSLPAKDAATVTSEMVDAVSHGKTTFDELTGSLHSVTPLAAALHVPLTDILADVAAMTASGESADQATQNMADALRHLQSPTSIMTSELAQLGITSSDLSDDLSSKGLSGTIQEISTAILSKMGPSGKVMLDALNQSKTAAADLQTMIKTMPSALGQASQSLLDGKTSITDYQKAAKDMGGTAGAMALQFLSLYKTSDGFNQLLKSGSPAAQSYSAALQKAMGDSAGLTVALQLTGEHADAVNSSIKDISGSAADASGNIKGWSEVQGNFNQKLAEAEAGAKSLAIEAGEHLLPALTAGVGWIADKGVPALEDLGHWLGQVAQSSAVQATLHGIADAGHLMWTALHDVDTVLGPVASGLGHLFGSLPGPVQATTIAIVAFNIARKAGWLSSAGSAEAEASAGIIRRSMASVGAVATETAMVTASSYGRMSAAYTEAAAAARASAAIQEGAMSSTAITGALAGTTAAARNLATQGFGAVKAGASGLMTMFGGPWGVALLGGIAAITSITSALDKQATAEKNAKTVGEQLGQSYQQLNTVYGLNADKAREQAKSQAGLNDILKTAGVSQQTYTQALEGNKQAQKEVTDALDSAGTRWNGLLSGQVSIGDVLTDNTGKWKDQAQAIFDGVNGNVTAFDHFNRTVSDGGTALESLQRDADKVFGKGNLLNQGVSTVQQGMDELAKSSGSTEKSLQGITDILDGITGKGVSAAKAQADLTTALNDVAGSFKDSGPVVDTHTKALDLNSKAGAELYQRLENLGDGYKTSVNEAYAAAGGINNAAAASAAAGDAAQKLYDQFILTATGAGMSRQAAEDLAKQLGIVPGSVVTTFTTPGLNASQAGVAYLQGQVNVITSGPHDVTVTALTADAESRLTAVGLHVTHLPDGTVQITADTYAAQSSLDAFIRANAYRVVTIHGVVEYTGSNIISGGKVIAQAAGGVVHAYAGGGIEAMAAGVAQVVHPNTLRVIGDRVKDDEFYIPDNSDARSLAIGKEYVRRHPEVAAGAMGAVGYNAAGTGFTASPATMPGYSAAATPAAIDYGRLGQAVAAAMQSTGGGRGGALVEMSGPVSIGDQSDVHHLAQELNFLARTRGQ